MWHTLGERGQRAAVPDPPSSPPDSGRVFLVTAASMKLLRATFCSPAHQFLHLGFAELFFRFDCRGVSEGLLLDFFLVSVLLSKASELATGSISKLKRDVAHHMV